MTITITINDDKVSYTAHQITAPAAYDGFGTISLRDWTYDGKTTRLILIREEHRRWQEGRYNSGMFYLAEPEVELSAIMETLWHRIAGKEQ